MSSSLNKIKRQVAKMEEQQKDAATKEEASGPGAPFGITIDPGGAVVFIEFNPEKHCVKVDFDRKKIKTWDMVLGYLHMAIIQAETQRELNIARNMAKEQAKKDEAEFLRLQLMQNQEGRRILQH
jgi:hypothetical protein